MLIDALNTILDCLLGILAGLLRFLEVFVPLAFKVLFFGSPFFFFVGASYFLGGILIAIVAVIFAIILIIFGWAYNKKLTSPVSLPKRVFFVIGADIFIIALALIINSMTLPMPSSRGTSQPQSSGKQKSNEQEPSGTLPVNNSTQVQNGNSQKGIANKNTNIASAQINTNGSEAISAPSPPPSPLSSPSSLWDFIDNSYPPLKKRNKDEKIGKSVRWDLVLSSIEPGEDEDTLILWLHEDENDFNNDQTQPYVICHVSLSKYPKLKRLDTRDKNLIRVAGNILEILDSGQNGINKPQIKLSNGKLSFLGSSDAGG